MGEHESHHLWDYGATGAKPWNCKGNICTVYYQKLSGPACCYCDDVDKPKQCDIQAKDTLFAKTNFSGFEDTTELNDNPVKNAEHWTTFNKVPLLNVTYEYFLHREDNGD